MTNLAPTLMANAASSARVWWIDVRSAAQRLVLPTPRHPLPTPDVVLLREPIDLATLFGPVGLAPEPEDQVFGVPGPSAPVQSPTPRSSLPVSRHAVPPRTPSEGFEDVTHAPGRSSDRVRRRGRAEPVLASPSAEAGAGAARLAALLQRYEALEQGEASAPVGIGGPSHRPPHEHAKTWFRRPRPLKARSSSPAVPGSVVVPLPFRSRRQEAPDQQSRSALASMQDVVDRRLRTWTDGLHLPSPPPVPAKDAGGRSRAQPSTRWSRAGPPDELERAPRQRAPGPPEDGRGPVDGLAERGALATLIRLVERAVADLAAVDLRLSDLGEKAASPGPEVQWLEDDELAGRLQGILARQARRQGIDLS